MCSFSLADHKMLSISCGMLVAQPGEPGEPSSRSVDVITVKHKYNVHTANENKY